MECLKIKRVHLIPQLTERNPISRHCMINIFFSVSLSGGGAEGRERENPKQDPCPTGSLMEAPSHNHEIMTWAKIKSWTLKLFQESTGRKCYLQRRVPYQETLGIFYRPLKAEANSPNVLHKHVSSKNTNVWFWNVSENTPLCT